jgi:hypothetical protein
VSWEQDNSGTADIDITLQYSPQHYYELDNKTCTTDDYEELAIASAHSGTVLASVSAEDAGYEILQRPFRSARFVVDNDSGTAVTAFTLWFEGVS